MTRVVLSEAARLDRREITAYTAERFGLDQARRLRDRFEVTLRNLAESPLMGRANEDLDPPGRSFRYFVMMRRFIIVYQPTDDGIRVARLLHGARDLTAELDRDAGDDGEPCQGRPRRDRQGHSDDASPTPDLGAYDDSRGEEADDGADDPAQENWESEGSDPAAQDQRRQESPCDTEPESGERRDATRRTLPTRTVRRCTPRIDGYANAAARRHQKAKARRSPAPSQ